MRWAYGITTVPSRICDLLPRTVSSLARAGFDNPRLFVDGGTSGYEHFGLSVTYRQEPIRIVGNFILGLWELYLRDPRADRYAVFQDDIVTYRGLKEYLGRIPYPDKGYLNLYTFPANQVILGDRMGFRPSDQLGKGAAALVFSREAVTILLGSQHIITKPQDASRGDRQVDGGIVDSFRKAGWREFVHNPSLVQHTGDISSMGNSRHPQAISFRGEEFDARDLLEKR